MANYILNCMERNKIGVPFWFLYLLGVTKFLIVLNASGNLVIYLATGSNYRMTFLKITRQMYDTIFRKSPINVPAVTRDGGKPDFFQNPGSGSNPGFWK